MSSRRTVGEDNILAMLERDSARRSGTRASNLRLACYGAAAAFAGILAGGVAWLAYDNHKSAADLQAAHDALVMVPPVVANASPPPDATAPMLPPPAAEAPRAAVIVDDPEPAPHTASNTAGAVPPLAMPPPQNAVPARTATRAATQPAPQVARSSALPPLVMLPRHESAPARAVAPAPAPRPGKDAAGTSPAKPRTAQLAARGSETKADKKAGKAQRPATRAAKPAPTRSVARATASDTARQRKAAAAAPQVDSDVALISAIIAQSERHRGEREAAAACDGAKCPSKPAQP